MAEPPLITPFTTTHMDHLFTGKFAQTAASFEDETWLMIKSYSEVRARGKKLALQHGCPPNDTLAAWKRFHGYVQSAENYWIAAKTTPWQTNSLLYYYCYLNLVKGLLVLTDPSMPFKINHGISFNPGKAPTAFKKNVVTFDNQPESVFRRFYSSFTKKSIPQDFNIFSALAYVHDIGEQFISMGGHPKAWGFMYRVVSSQGDASHKGNIWSLLAIPKAAKLATYKTSYPAFFKEYHLVSVSGGVPPYMRETFQLKLHQWEHFDFYERTHKLENLPGAEGLIRMGPKRIFGESLQMNVYNDNQSAFLNLPFNTKKAYMNEELAIYIMMFYLSSVVRYKPDYFYQLSGQTPIWMVESFIKSSNLKFLRRYLCLLEKQNIILTGI